MYNIVMNNVKVLEERVLEEKAVLYENKKDYINAIIYYEKIITIQPYNLKIINQIGVLYNNMLNYEKAIEYFKKVITIKKDIPDVYNNIGVCYVCLKKYKMAEICYIHSMKLRDDNGINYSLGNLYFYMKDYDKSILFYRKISDLDKDPKKLYNLSFPYLAKQDFTTGLPLYENRLKYNDNQRVEIPWIPYWDGIERSPNLLVLYEQGIGDNIQYFRFIIMLSNLYPSMQISYFCKDVVAHLFKEYPRINIVNKLTVNIFNYKAYIMSLPFLLKLDKIDTFPIDYIKTDNNLVEYWKDKFSLLKKKKVGFVYNGLLTSFIEKQIPLTEFEILCDDTIDLICIHKKSDIIDDIIKINNKNIHFYDIDMDKPFADTIAILKNIDLLITVDTAIVHLAGTMGVKTWLLLGYGSDWRWSNTTNYWYPSVELLRMTENIEFKNILKLVKNNLKNLFS